MRINSVSDVKCFCNNKNVLRAQSMVWHFVRHSVLSREANGFILLIEYYSNDPTKKNEMEEACSACGGERYVKDFGGEAWGKELIGRSSRRWKESIIMYLQEVGWENMNWNDLAQERDRWQAIIMWWWTFGFHKMRGITRPAEELLHSQEEF